jgi:hypothetical protein
MTKQKRKLLMLYRKAVRELVYFRENFNQAKAQSK